MAKNIYEKIWDAHVVYEPEGQDPILYIDRHYVHEVTSPQAFEGLRLAGRTVRRPELTFATMDHNIPTTNRALPIADPLFAAAGGDAGDELQGIRRHTLRHEGPQEWNRACDGAGAGVDPAGHDHRMW